MLLFLHELNVIHINNYFLFRFSDNLNKVKYYFNFNIYELLHDKKTYKGRFFENYMIYYFCTYKELFLHIANIILNNLVEQAVIHSLKCLFSACFFL